ncbi:MAG: D-2-hydroxyacid dehydrogenase [Alicyclobacillus sp.]|nr:D-2-hydroxyacid dehydrogenase [Alicyclobacillus sp.]
MIFVDSAVPEDVVAWLRGQVQEDVRVRDRDKDLTEQAHTAEIVVGYASPRYRELIGASQALRWFHCLSAGVEGLPFEQLSERGVVVTNSSGIHATQMAEQIIGMMIMFTRGLHVNVRNQVRRVWDRSYPVSELAGQTLCVVGAGRIGRELARKAKAFDMRVIGVKRRPEALPGFDEVLGVRELERGLHAADFVAVLTPLTGDTRRMFGRAALAAMKPSAVLLNFARGDVVDEAALVEALQQGRIRGAGLDVFEREPLPEDSPLWGLDNVIMSPHNAGHIPDYHARAVRLFVDNYRAYRAGQPMPNRVDLSLGY